MFKAIRKMREAKQKRENLKKYQAIFAATVQYYSDLDKMQGGINLPPFIRANKAISECIKSKQDLERCYKSLLKFKTAA